MTEEEWLTCDDASAMVRAIAGTASARKIRLYGVACCRHLERIPASPEFFQALEAAENHVDVKPNKAALRRARRALRSIRVEPLTESGAACGWGALWLAEVAASENTAIGVIHEIPWLGADLEGEWPPGEDLARCIFGNPHRVPHLGSEGLSSTVLDLARSIYGDRDFERLPILADALEESDCVDASILAHCREDRVHAKGCWVVDLILGK